MSNKTLRDSIKYTLEQQNNGIIKIPQKIDKFNVGHMERYHPAYDDISANKWLVRLISEIKLICKFRWFKIKTIIFPTVCRLGRNRIMIEFFDWIFNKYNNKKIDINIQIYFVYEDLVINRYNFENNRSNLLNRFDCAHNEIKKLVNGLKFSKNSKKRKSMSDDTSELDEKINEYDDQIFINLINTLSINNNNNNDIVKSNCRSNLLILRHSSDNISYSNKRSKLNNDEHSKALREDCKASREDFINREPDERCNICNKYIADHKSKNTGLLSYINPFNYLGNN